MEVKLLKPALGQEIVNAFKDAGTDASSYRQKWESKYRKKFANIEKISNEPSEVKEVTAWATFSTKNFLFGWKDKVLINLPYLNPTATYEKIEIELNDMTLGFSVPAEYDDEDIFPFQQNISEFITRFKNKLQPEKVA